MKIRSNLIDHITHILRACSKKPVTKYQIHKKVSGLTNPKLKFYLLRMLENNLLTLCLKDGKVMKREFRPEDLPDYCYRTTPIGDMVLRHYEAMLQFIKIGMDMVDNPRQAKITMEEMWRREHPDPNVELPPFLSRFGDEPFLYMLRPLTFAEAKSLPPYTNA